MHGLTTRPECIVTESESCSFTGTKVGTLAGVDDDLHTVACCTLVNSLFSSTNLTFGGIVDNSVGESDCRSAETALSASGLEKAVADEVSDAD